MRGRICFHSVICDQWKQNFEWLDEIEFEKQSLEDKAVGRKRVTNLARDA